MMHKTWFSKKILWTEWTQKFNQKGLAWGCLMTPFLKISNNYKGSIYRTISIQILQKSLYPETPCHKNNAETPKIHRKLLKTKRPKKKTKKSTLGCRRKAVTPPKNPEHHPIEKLKRKIIWTNLPDFGFHVSNVQNLMTFHYTGSLIRSLIMVYYNPHITG